MQPTNPTRTLAGKTLVITGGTQGLGEGVARYCAERGAENIVICGRNRERGEAVAAALSQQGVQSLFVPADLANEAECRRVIRGCDEAFGRIDGLVNAAGITDRGTLEETTVDLWDRIFAVNARAPFVLIQESVRIMRRENERAMARGQEPPGGSIVNILSISAHGGPPFIMAYCASKGALATLTKNLAHSLRWDRIRVNGINMGWMATENEHKVQRAMGKPENWLEQAEAEKPFGRILRPRDVASLTAYLLSDESQLMTGSLIDYDQNVVGGGM